jgi:hypothetical protein
MPASWPIRGRVEGPAVGDSDPRHCGPGNPRFGRRCGLPQLGQKGLGKGDVILFARLRMLTRRLPLFG